MLRGKRVVLRALEREDADLLHAWLNDRETTRWLLINPPVSRAAEEWWIEREISSDSSKLFILCTLDLTPIGTVSLNHINWTHRKARVGISIFEPRMRGKGLGTEAMELLLDHAFFDMGLNRVELDVFEENSRAQRSYEKCGFSREGTMRDAYFKDGRFIDAVLMSILHREWRKRRGE